MKGSVVIKILAFTFFAASAIVLLLGFYSLSWPTVDADVEYREPNMIYISGLTRNNPRAGTTYQKELVDLQVVSYAYYLGGVMHSNSTVCYCWHSGIARKPNPPLKAPVSYFRPYPQISVLKPGPDFLFAALLALCGAAILYSYRMFVSFFTTNA